MEDRMELIDLAVSELLTTTREWFDSQADKTPCRWCRGRGHTVEECEWAGSDRMFDI